MTYSIHRRCERYFYEVPLLLPTLCFFNVLIWSSSTSDSLLGSFRAPGSRFPIPYLVKRLWNVFSEVAIFLLLVEPSFLSWRIENKIWKMLLSSIFTFKLKTASHESLRKKIWNILFQNLYRYHNFQSYVKRNHLFAGHQFRTATFLLDIMQFMRRNKWMWVEDTVQD